MEVDEALDYFTSLKGVESEFKQSWQCYVFKLGGKVIGYIPENNDGVYKVNLKCDPLEAVELRERYQGVEPGFHANKKHWNTVSFKQDVPDAEIRRQILNSYMLILKSLKKDIRESLQL